MSIKITTDVVCDECRTWAYGWEGTNPDAFLARLAVRKRGWTRRGEFIDGKWVSHDLCPQCRVGYSD